jgi:hypothetical protein
MLTSEVQKRLSPEEAWSCQVEDKTGSNKRRTVRLTSVVFVADTRETAVWLITFRKKLKIVFGI